MSSITSEFQTQEIILQELIESCSSGDLEQVKSCYAKLQHAMIGIASPLFSMKIKMRDAAMAAATAGESHVLDFLLSNKGGPTVEICGELSTKAASGSKAKAGSTEIFDVLLKYGWGPDMECPYQGNALTCIIDCNISAIQFLLDHGASPSRPLQQFHSRNPRKQRWAIPFGLTPLDFAASHGTPEIITMLLSYGADLSNCDALHSAATALWHDEENYHEIIKLLLQKGMDINSIEGTGHHDRIKDFGVDTHNYPLGTPLHYATREVHPDRVKFLLKMGADKNIKATNGLTALQWIEGNEDFWDEEIGAMLMEN